MNFLSVPNYSKSNFLSQRSLEHTVCRLTAYESQDVAATTKRVISYNIVVAEVF